MLAAEINALSCDNQIFTLCHYLLVNKRTTVRRYSCTLFPHNFALFSVIATVICECHRSNYFHYLHAYSWSYFTQLFLYSRQWCYFIHYFANGWRQSSKLNIVNAHEQNNSFSDLALFYLFWSI